MQGAEPSTVDGGKGDRVVYGPDGYDADGYDKDGYDREGFDQLGFNRHMRDRFGHLPAATYPEIVIEETEIIRIRIK